MTPLFAKAVNAAIELASPLVNILPAPVLTGLELALLEPYLATKPAQVSTEAMADAMNQARSAASGMVDASVSLYRSDVSAFQSEKLDEWRKTLDDYLWRCVIDAIYAACIMEDHKRQDEFWNSAQKIADGNMGLIVRSYEDTLFDDNNFRKKYIIIRRVIHDAARHFLKTVA
jgi:hypothetical protein